MTVESPVNTITLDDINIHPNRPGALDSLAQLIQEASINKILLRRLAQNLVKSYNTAPDTLMFYLGLDWKERDMSFFSAYREVLLIIASIHPKSVSIILHTLVSRLCKKGAAEEKVSDIKPDIRAVDALISLVKLVPSASKVLLAAIESHFPFHARGIHEHISYVSSILEIGKRLPKWRIRLIELVISKALVIDVELQNYSDIKVDLDHDAVEEADSSLLADSISDEELTRRKRVQMATEVSKKLDKIIELLFEQVSDLSVGETKSTLFTLLLSCFEKFILPTFKSRHLQFLIFYMVSQEPKFADQFLGQLFKPLVKFCQGLDEGKYSRPSLVTLTCVGYIGSFTARANFLSADFLKMSFEMLSDLVCRLLRLTTIDILPVMALQHVLYIFCSRSQEIIDLIGEDELMDLFDLILTENASVLLYCDKVIVRKFIELADKQLELLDPEVAICYEKLLAGQGNKVPESKCEDLERYFPFDPVMLPSINNRLAPEMYKANDDNQS